jgi:hypothetical protein
MRTCEVRHAFISTYNTTIFVKRVADNSFLISDPFSYDATNPSIRQLFAGFCMLASNDPNYYEGPDFDPNIVSIFTDEYAHRSGRLPTRVASHLSQLTHR